MIRASNLYRICTNRPVNNVEDLNAAKNKLIEKVNGKKMIFSEEDIDTYLTTQGLITVAKDFLSEKEKYANYLRDELPVGAKTYMKELWLDTNYGFVEFSLNEEAFSLQKGKLVEDEAIKVIGSLYGLELKKNDKRVEKGFLTGEADIIYQGILGENIVRDNKSPISWVTFRNKYGIPAEYYWQLIGYCYLYDAKEAWLDYTFMPTPTEIIEAQKVNLTQESYDAHIKMNEVILNLPLDKRVKSYKLDTNISGEISFMLGRIDRCKEYYDTLTYEKCMNIQKQED